MRHLVLALMIALLPLRGWAGDVMATQMAVSAVSIEAISIEAIAIEKRAPDARETGGKAFFIHHKQMVELSDVATVCHEQLGGHPDTAPASNSEHCTTCPACQVCHTVALSPSSLDVTISFASPQLAQTSASTFTSADAALGQKPPIS